jgi:hypothetical protein
MGDRKRPVNQQYLAFQRRSSNNHLESIKPYTMRTSVATPAERLDEILPRLGDAAEITELPSRALQ